MVQSAYSFNFWGPKPWNNYPKKDCICLKIKIAFLNHFWDHFFPLNRALGPLQFSFTAFWSALHRLHPDMVRSDGCLSWSALHRLHPDMVRSDGCLSGAHTGAFGWEGKKNQNFVYAINGQAQTVGIVNMNILRISCLFLKLICRLNNNLCLLYNWCG